MFNISYDKETGDILNYQEGPDASGLKTPDGFGSLSFPFVPAGFLTASHQVAMYVDIETGKLDFLTANKIPDPIPNPPNAAK